MVNSGRLVRQEDGIAFPDQPHSVAAQLRAGVRGLMLDAHVVDGEVRLCHEIPVLKGCTDESPEAVKLFTDIGTATSSKPSP